MSTLVHDLTRLAARLSVRVAGVPDNTRLRIAVSPQEYDEIRRFMLGERGVYYARLLDVPLVVEEQPVAPELKREYADDRQA